MYDWAHGIEDSLEGITHSICTLEFENHRPLYDWFLAGPRAFTTRSRSSSRGCNLTYTVMSKRKLLAAGAAASTSTAGTTRACRRSRACAGAATRRRRSARSATTSASPSTTPRSTCGVLENALRDDLNKRAPSGAWRCSARSRSSSRTTREGQTEELDAVNNPEDAAAGTRKVPFSRELYIERDDFMEDPPKKFFRLAPGDEVRLRYAYFIKCTTWSEGRGRRSRPSSAAPTTPRRAAATRPTGAR